MRDEMTLCDAGVSINPAQDYVAGIMYYAVEVRGMPYILTSRKELVPFHFSGRCGFHLSSTTPPVTRFSALALAEYLEAPGRLESPVDLFQQIRSYIKKYVFLKDDRAYTLLALWTMHTYVHYVFPHSPNIHLNADKGCGKTTLMEIMAPICFNGVLSADSTGAALCQEISTNSSTLFLDEVEHLTAGKSGLLMRILKSGFSRSGKIIRLGRSYSTYGPKMFAGIADVDDVLGDRMIRLRMIKKLPGEAVQRYCQNEETLAWQAATADSLYMFGLEFGATISGIYERGLPPEAVSHLENRSWDLWAPLLSIAVLIDQAEVLAEIIELSREHVEAKNDSDLLDNETSRAIAVLNALVREASPAKVNDGVRYYDADLVFSYFRVQEFFRNGETRTSLSRLLQRKFGVRCEPQKWNGAVRRMYGISLVDLQDLTDRYLPGVRVWVPVEAS